MSMAVYSHKSTSACTRYAIVYNIYSKNFEWENFCG